MFIGSSAARIRRQVASPHSGLCHCPTVPTPSHTTSVPILSVVISFQKEWTNVVTFTLMSQCPADTFGNCGNTRQLYRRHRMFSGSYIHTLHRSSTSCKPSVQLLGRPSHIAPDRGFIPDYIVFIFVSNQRSSMHTSDDLLCDCC